jgi:hypothetical protein
VLEGLPVPLAPPLGLEPPELDPPVEPLAPDDPPVDAAGAEATLLLELVDVVVLVVLAAAGAGALVEGGTVNGGVPDGLAAGDPPPQAATSKDRASPAIRAANNLERRARLPMGAALRTRAGPCACRNAGSR